MTSAAPMKRRSCSCSLPGFRVQRWILPTKDENEVETTGIKRSPTFTSRDSTLSNLERKTTPLIGLPLG